MKRLSLLLLFSLLFLDVQAQSLKDRHARQEQLVRANYEQHKITANEFYKLMRELDIIKTTLNKYNKDGKLSARETRTIEDKMIKANARLEKYLTNNEEK
jgi:hypothetical protein